MAQEGERRMMTETTRASESRSCLVRVEPGEATETGG